MKIHTVRKWLGFANIAFVALAILGIYIEGGNVDLGSGLLLVLMSVSAYYLITNRK